MAGELQYRNSDGKLLYAESGSDVDKLLYECCCPVICCSDTCNATYTAVVSGYSATCDVSANDSLAGLLNGSHVMSNVSPTSGASCQWNSTYMALRLFCSGGTIFLNGTVAAGGGFNATWTKAHTTGCDVTGTYAYFGCTMPSGCCTGFTGTTVTVT